jgi:hypothetical protein
VARRRRKWLLTIVGTDTRCRLRLWSAGIDNFYKSALLGSLTVPFNCISLTESTMAQLSIGICETCHKHFEYSIYHCGFGDCAYAYCDRCGRCSLLSVWFQGIPPGTSLKVHGPIEKRIEPKLLPCPCGGAFRAEAPPRCSNGSHALDAALASGYIEQNAPGTLKGWRWQRNWSGVYCIDVEGRAVRDNWRPVSV